MYVGSSCFRSSIVEVELKKVGDEALQYLHSHGVHQPQMLGQTIANI